MDTFVCRRNGHALSLCRAPLGSLVWRVSLDLRDRFCISSFKWFVLRLHSWKLVWEVNKACVARNWLALILPDQDEEPVDTVFPKYIFVSTMKTDTGVYIQVHMDMGSFVGSSIHPSSHHLLNLFSGPGAVLATLGWIASLQNSCPPGASECDHIRK